MFPNFSFRAITCFSTVVNNRVNEYNILYLVFFLILWLILFIQLGTFLMVSLLLSWPTLLLCLVPKSLRHARAKHLARQQFFMQNLHHTKNSTGVLIFISEAERYVEILADQGIHHQVPNETWQNIVDHFIARIKMHQTFDGLLDCLNSCGLLLAQHVPATMEKNELPNRLILI